MSAPKHKSKKRLLLLMITVLVAFAALAGKMGYIVFAQGEELQQKALMQQIKDTSVAADRGSILDRNGNVLAKSANAQTVVIRPDEIAKGNVDSIVSKLAEVLSIDEETVRKKATNTNKKEIWLARQISDDDALELKKLSLPGVYFTVEIKRYYPNSAFLAQTLGFTSVDGVGLEGIEAYFDGYLSGEPGRIVSETDVDGNEIPLGQQDYIAPENGYNVVLTIDEVVQSFLESALEEACEKEGAQGAWGVAMDPNTGEILAMECIPDYDLNDIPNDDMEVLSALSRNKIITQEYEPGGVFEAITAASALDSAVIDGQTEISCGGYELVMGEQIKCSAYPESHGDINLFEAAQRSCSVTFANMGIDMGTQVFYDYIYDFGFGQETGITFPADVSGSVMSEKYVQNSDLARMAFGQSIAVTPLQLISSVSAVVNGGFLYEPKLIKALEDSEGNIVEEYEPKAVSQPIRAQTSQTMRQVLESVVSEGLGRQCTITGYSVGGIGGTSLKYDDEGSVIEGAHTDSFIGFAPADDPQIMVLIIVDEPESPSQFGILTAAPYVKSVLSDSLKYLGIKPGETEEYEPAVVLVPDVMGLSLEEALGALEQAGLYCLADGTGNVTGQEPAAEELVLEASTVKLYMDTQIEDIDMQGKLVVPDLTGLSVMEISVELKDFDLKIVIQGSGTAVSQSPAAGEIVDEGSSITVRFSTSPG